MRLFLLFALTIALPIQAQQLSIMTFNVENLFDNRHDEGKNDETYLPIAQKSSPQHVNKCKKIRVEYWRNQCLHWDWSDEVVAKKLAAIGAAIKQVNDGRGPDIIAFQEVENQRILERLRDEHLAELGYQSLILLEGRDIRGIDVAFLAKYPSHGAKLHEIAFSKTERDRVGDTRPILEATFDIGNGESLTGFAVHFPAPFHPTPMREAAYGKLNELLTKLPVDRLVFAAGDFNTTSEEDRKQNMLKNWVRPFWQVAHDYCDGCPGSSYYPPKDDWSFLDMVIWRPAKHWQIVSSYLANETEQQQTDKETPKRFRLPEATGLSDHWPLVMVVEPNQQTSRSR